MSVRLVEADAIGGRIVFRFEEDGPITISRGATEKRAGVGRIPARDLFSREAPAGAGAPGRGHLGDPASPRRERSTR